MFGPDDETKDLIGSWERRLQFTYIAPSPPEAFDPNLPAMGDEAKSPRPNVVMSRTHATSDTARAAANAFLEQTAPTIPGLDLLYETQFRFRDGTEGFGVAISFPATEAVTLTQFHAFRIDGDTLTQLVATCSVQQADEWMPKLHAALAGFRPD